MRMLALALLFVALCVAGCLEAKPEPRPVEPQPAAVPPVAEPPKAETPPAIPVPVQPPIVEPPKEPAAPEPQPSAETAAETVNPWRPIASAEQPTSVAQPPAGASPTDDQWATEADLGGTASAASPGMGRQGRGYGGDIATYPIATYFQMRERIGLDQMAKAMQLYQAMNGHYPRTQDEFRNEIIKPNAIRLPVLPDGHKFYYDPEKHELVVIKPRD